MPIRYLARVGRRRGESGAAAVEFALVFSVILVPLLFGLLQYGWYFYVSQTTSSATRETARRLSVGDCQDTAQQFARNMSHFDNLVLNYGSVHAQNNKLPNVGEVLRVKAEMDGAIFNFMPMPGNGAIERTVDVRVEDSTPDSPC